MRRELAIAIVGVVVGTAGLFVGALELGDALGYGGEVVVGDHRDDAAEGGQLGRQRDEVERA